MFEDDEEREVEQATESWIKTNNIPKSVSAAIVEAPVPDYSTEFYIKLERLGNKHYVGADKEADLITWLKLTAKLLD